MIKTRALDKLEPDERKYIGTLWAPVTEPKRDDINSDYRVKLGRGETEAIILVNTPITASDQISMLEWISALNAIQEVIRCPPLCRLGENGRRSCCYLFGSSCESRGLKIFWDLHIRTAINIIFNKSKLLWSRVFDSIWAKLWGLTWLELSVKCNEWEWVHNWG